LDTRFCSGWNPSRKYFPPKDNASHQLVMLFPVVGFPHTLVRSPRASLPSRCLSSACTSNLWDVPTRATIYVRRGNLTTPQNHLQFDLELRPLPPLTNKTSGSPPLYPRPALTGHRQGLESTRWRHGRPLPRFPGSELPPSTRKMPPGPLCFPSRMFFSWEA